MITRVNRPAVESIRSRFQGIRPQPEPLHAVPRETAASLPTASAKPGVSLLQSYFMAAPTVRPLRFAGAAAAPETWPYGVSFNAGKTRFKLWAPHAEAVELLVISPEPKGGRVTQRITRALLMQPSADGDSFTLERADLPPGTLYMYRLKAVNGAISQPLPDMRSSFQPEDVHGPSEVIDHSQYQWQATHWQPPKDKRRFNIEKVHIGTFTPEGTFASAIRKLDKLKGKVTHIELMPVKEFPGNRNWGYDMVDFFATENAYGRPEDLQRFVDECHKRGIAVMLDLVYNHIGPEGNYLRQFDHNFLGHQQTPWGEGFNWQNEQALQFVIDNALSWVRNFKVDGFRFDMTNFINDDTVLSRLTKAIHQEHPEVYLVAEDGRTSNHITLPRDSGGLGFWAKWNFEHHHWLKSLITRMPHMHASPNLRKLAYLLRNGFPEGNAPMNSLHDAVNFFETHDEIGNHDGKRTLEKVGRRRFMLGSVLKFFIPGIPMTFMGERHGEKSPFHFFVNYSDPVCIKGVREGRKNSPSPDCLEESTFKASKLSWLEDLGITRMNDKAVALRNAVPALWQGDQNEMTVQDRYIDSGVLAIHRKGRENPESEALILINDSDYDYKRGYGFEFPPGEWEEVFNTEDIDFGNSGETNQGRVFSGNQSITLMGSSLAVFRKKPKA